MKYIDSEKLVTEINRVKDENAKLKWACASQISSAACCKEEAYDKVLSLITSLQQEQPKGNLEYWLEHFGMPKENIDNCITQIAQGYGACRYLEGIQHGAEAVNELAKQEQPEVNLEKFAEKMDAWKARYNYPDNIPIKAAMAFTARMFYQYPNVARQWYDSLPKATMD